MNEIEMLQLDLTTGLLQATRQWRRRVEQALAAHGVSEACASPLLWIGRLGGGVRQVTLAAYVGIEGPSLVRLLDQLVASQLAERREDPVDRRAKTVWLTGEGARLRDEIEALLVSLRAQLLANVPREDLEATLRVLKVFEGIEAHASTGRGSEEPAS